MTKRSVYGFAMLSMVLSTVACAAEPEEEERGETTNHLVSGSPTGNVLITPDELGDPTTGCFVSNPTCSLNPPTAFANPVRESFVLSSDECARRASDHSSYCGNGRQVVSTSIFRVHGQPIRTTAFAPTNDTRCVVTVGLCAKSPASSGTFGDSFDGADTNPIRCAARAKDYYDWCANPRAATVATHFDRGGVPGPLTVWPAP